MALIYRRLQSRLCVYARTGDV